MKLVRLPVLAAALCLLALPAGAAAAGPPAGTPTATDNPGSANVPAQAQARAIGRKQCQEFKANFDSRREFGKCVAAAARVGRTRVTPRQACGDLGLSRKREEGQARSDFNACVVAAARGAREGERAAAAS